MMSSPSASLAFGEAMGRGDDLSHGGIGPIEIPVQVTG